MADESTPQVQEQVASAAPVANPNPAPPAPVEGVSL